MNQRSGQQERIDWLQLARTPNIGPVTFHKLLERFGSAAGALEALPEISRQAGRKSPLRPPARARCEDELRNTEHYGGGILTARDPDYPRLLRQLDPPPPVLSYLGDTSLAGRPAIAIVGARNASAAGRKIARDMSAELGQAGFVMVSGLARGIDGECHAASLSTGTIAVLGGGIDHVYPPQHERLYAAIAAQGLLISESPFAHKATAKDFPRRNRLITGLALGTVIVEAAERSGSLISARTAAEQNREVMAIPGSPLDPRAAGTNKLIREGAALVRSAADVIEIMSPLSQRTLQAPDTSEFDGEHYDEHPPTEQIDAVREALGYHPMPIDEIARAAGLGAARCASILVELELLGEVATFSGGLACRLT